MLARLILFLMPIFDNYLVKSRSIIKPDKDLNITQIIEKYGYPVEAHEIVTKDGYILEHYRIPQKTKDLDIVPKKNPVILVHGLMGSAENFIVAGPKKSLTYMLANKNYDVWLFNSRGTWHSRKHSSLDPDKDAEYWKFTWHEIGVYDLPATIDYILNVTKSTKVHYVGHSQGTTSFFVMCSEKPEYNEKIKVMVAMAPSVIYRNINQPVFGNAGILYSLTKIVADVLHINELIPYIPNSDLRRVGNAVCGSLIPMTLCRLMLTSLIFGSKSDQLDLKRIPIILSTFPAGASLQQVFHYAQVIITGEFQNYDWGKNENLKRYNSTKPPKYNLDNIKAPVALIYSEGDNIVTKKDVLILSTLLSNVVEMYEIPYKYWNHGDYIWAKDIDILLNEKVVGIIDKNGYVG